MNRIHSNYFTDESRVTERIDKHSEADRGDSLQEHFSILTQAGQGGLRREKPVTDERMIFQRDDERCHSHRM